MSGCRCITLCVFEYALYTHTCRDIHVFIVCGCYCWRQAPKRRCGYMQAFMGICFFLVWYGRMVRYGYEVGWLAV